MNDLLLLCVITLTVELGIAWLVQRVRVRRRARHLRRRLGVLSPWEQALEVRDDELLLDPSVELPERRSLVLLVGDAFDASTHGRRLRARLRAADLALKPSEALALVVMLALVAAVAAELLFSQGPAFDLPLGGLCALIVCWLVLRARRDRRRQTFTRQLADVAELITNALRAGLSLQNALEFVAREAPDPAREEFGAVVREMRLGGSLDDALDNLLQRMPGTDLEVMVTTIKVQRLAGGNLIKSMGALARTLSERERTNEEIKTMLSQPLFSSYLMPVLAVATLALLNRLLPGFVDVLFRTPPGWIVLLVFVGLQVGGMLLIQRLARVKV